MVPHFVTIRRRALPRNAQDELRYGGQILEPDPKVYGTDGDLVTLPEDIARWVFSGERYMVHDQAGNWVHRYGIVQARNVFLDQLGRPEVLEVSPFALDAKRIEFWNTEAVGVPRETIVSRYNEPPPNDRQPAAPYVPVGR